jgi:ADP-dependent NAD(P)H-hydrate dehydratase / NAD(P)H-hydrate epimerase
MSRKVKYILSSLTDKTVLHKDELKLLEKTAEDVNNIQPVILMEEASSKILEQLKKDFDISAESICIIAGNGNNGGDALSLARKMYFESIKTDIYVFKDNNGTKLYELQKSILDSMKIGFFEIGELAANIGKYTIVIDGIFGIGFKDKGNRYVENIFRMINDSGSKIVSMDVPSGLFKDNYSVRADFTYSIGFLKDYFFNINTRKSVGVIRDLKISFNLDNLGSHDLTYYLDSIDPMPIKKNNFVHKYSRGGCIFIGGSQGKLGSIAYSSESGLRSGCGISIVLTENTNISGLNSISKSIVIDDINNYEKYFNKINTVIIGPGLDLEESGNRETIRKIFSEDKYFILDASFFSQFDKSDLFAFKKIPILTPHSGEFRSFFKDEADGMENDTISSVRKVSVKYKCITVLKDSFITIGFPSGKVIIYDHPCRLLSQAGSGDILSGIIGGIMSQEKSPDQERMILESLRIFYDVAGMIASEGYKTYSPDHFIDLVGRSVSQ